ncbi:hypothetical protein EO238_30750, partial [Citrobacter sp. AAK_AS5]
TYRLASSRSARGATLITTTKGIQDWPELFAGDEVLATAILDQDADPALRDYLTRVWDSFGIDIEPGSGATLILKPGVHRLHE